MSNKYNASGAYDPTAYTAIQSASADETRKDQFIKAIKLLAKTSDFEFIGRFTLRDNKTGKVWH